VIKLGFVYLLAGLMFAAFALFSAADRTNSKRLGNTAFWGLAALSFLAGDYLGDLGNGLLVLGLALLAGLGLLGRGEPATTAPAERVALSERFGNRLFVPALMLPLVVALGVLAFKRVEIGGAPLMDPKQATLISLALAVIVALAAALVLLRQPPASPLQEGRRLVDTVGWAVLLPQMLAALGAVFAMAGVGKVIGELATTYLPLDTRAAAVCVYCLGMAAFTMVMGNAFAAFPVLTGGIALPILVGHFGANPAVVASIEDLTRSTQTQVRIRDNITATSEMVNRMEVTRKQIEDLLKANKGKDELEKPLIELNKKILDVELKLVTKSEMLSDDKYFPEAYKVYMNLIWLSGGVGQGASDEAGGVEFKPTDTQVRVLTMLEAELAAAKAAMTGVYDKDVPAFNTAMGGKLPIIK